MTPLMPCRIHTCMTRFRPSEEAKLGVKMHGSNNRQLMDWARNVRLGQKRTFALQKGMSALPLKADMCGATRDVGYGPEADM